VVEALLHPGVGDKLPGRIPVEALALPPTARARDDINDVSGADAGDLLLDPEMGLAAA
jgi:hypothetical protein